MGDTTDERESHGCKGRMQLVGDGTAVASGPMQLSCCGFLACAARLWLLARCSAAVASCRMLCCCAFLPYAVRQWLNDEFGTDSQEHILLSRAL